MIRDDEQIEGQLSLFDLAPEGEERKPCEYPFKRYIGQVVEFNTGEVGEITDIGPYYTEVRTNNHRIMAGTPTTITPKKMENFADYIGQCKYCMWYGYGMYDPISHKRRLGTEGRACQWEGYGFMGCKDRSKWKPGEYAIPRLCSNCTWANQFCYQSKPEYKEDSLKAFHDPVEEPNIYCTHEDGSVNRQSPYKSFWTKGFGCNTWDRQHEWDTCDAWASDGWKLEHSRHRDGSEGSTT